MRVRNRAVITACKFLVVTRAARVTKKIARENGEVTTMATWEYTRRCRQAEKETSRAAASLYVHTEKFDFVVGLQYSIIPWMDPEEMQHLPWRIRPIPRLIFCR